MPRVELHAGWRVVDGVLGPHECDDLAAVCASRHWPSIPDALVEWITDPRWAPLVEPIVGPDPAFLREQLVTKPAHADIRVPWHQDSGYARVDGEFATCFVALDDITLANGCLWMLPDSHRSGPVAHVPSGYWREVATPIEEDGVAVELARGSAVVFSSFTVHRSGGNTTAGRRPAWMLQFAPAPPRHPPGHV